MLLAILALGMTQFDLRSPAGLAYDSEGVLYVSWMDSNVITVHRGIDEVRRIGEGLNSPRGLAFDQVGRLYVADSGSHRVLVFDRGGALLRTIGGEGSGDGQFRSPFDVLVDDRGNLIVADTFNNRLQIFDAEGRHQRTFGTLGDQPGQFREPAGLAFSSGLLYVAGGWNGRVDVFAYDSRALTLTHVRSLQGFWVCGDVAVLTDGSMVAVDRNNGWVGRWDKDANEVKRFTGGSYGLFRHPSAVVQTPTGELAIADTGNDRVLFLDTNFTDVSRPLLARMTSSFATVEWRTAPEDESPKLALFRRAAKHNGEHAFQREVTAVGKQGAALASVGNLEPGSGYIVRPTSALVRSIGGSVEAGRLRPLAFATQPREGEKTILNLPIAVIVRTDIWNPEGSGGRTDRGAPPGESYLEYVRKEFEDARLFYFVNSHCRVNLEYDWYIYTEPLTTNQERPLNANEDEILKTKGKVRRDYVALVVVDVERRFDPTRNAYYLQGSGGGTWGAHWNGMNKPADPAHCSFLGGSDLAWLMTHEFHHALDSMFEQSGYEEYPFNHFGDYRVGGYNGPFGEHWDGNAYILRVWPEQAWFYCLFGYVSTTRDRDNDGVPDDDPSLPIDERRWGSDPARVSTAGDGISDLGRLMFSNWVPATLESVNNAHVDLIRPDPRRTDQSGLGTPDAAKKEPCIPWLEEIPSGSPDLSKSLEDEPAWSAQRGRFRREQFEGRAYMTWDETGLYLALSFSERPLEFQITTDFTGDGFFAGQDNYVLTIDCRGERATIKSFHVLNGAQNRWPFADVELVPRDTIRLVSSFESLRSQVRIKLPWHLKSGLTCRPGDVYRFAFTFLVRDGVNQWNGDRIHVSAFEPYKMLPMRLAR
jgi:hypothetical protein